MQKENEYDVVIIGAGVSGLATLKCCLEVGLNAIAFEKSSSVGGLWKYRPDDTYGVMKFTTINVCKYNYAFSDFPFPEETPDYCHHTEMQAYIERYVEHFKLKDRIRLNSPVESLVRLGENSWKAVVANKEYFSRSVCITTGHHATPKIVEFPGMESFKGKIVQAVEFKDARTNNIYDKRVLVVGIGNSGVDAAVNCFEQGDNKVVISTRSGAWVFQPYLFGYAVDLYANRYILNKPWRLQQFVTELTTTLVMGHPNKWGLNPKQGMLQTQPTVSPILVNHLARKNIRIKPNIKSFVEGKTIEFDDGSKQDFDVVIMCTGYLTALPYLEQDIRDIVLDQKTNHVYLYKSVFSPKLGKDIAFIGFTQPASGGIISMSEMQARWFCQLYLGNVELPSEKAMIQDLKEEQHYIDSRWTSRNGSTRHTIQRDPIIYNDMIASMIGCKPSVFRFPLLAWRLWFSTCGVYMYRLQGPNKWDGAYDAILKTPVPPANIIFPFLDAAVLGLFIKFLLFLYKKSYVN